MSIQFAEFTIREIVKVYQWLSATASLGNEEEGPLSTLECLKGAGAVDEDKDCVVTDACDEIYLVGDTVPELSAFLMGLSIGLEGAWAELAKQVSYLTYPDILSKPICQVEALDDTRKEVCANIVAAYLGYATAVSTKVGKFTEVLQAVQRAKDYIISQDNILRQGKEIDYTAENIESVLQSISFYPWKDFIELVSKIIPVELDGEIRNAVLEQEKNMDWMKFQIKKDTAAKETNVVEMSKVLVLYSECNNGKRFEGQDLVETGLKEGFDEEADNKLHEE